MRKKKNEEGQDQQEASAESLEVPAVLQATDTRFVLARRMLQDMRERMDALERLLDADADSSGADVERLLSDRPSQDNAERMHRRAIEGVFDGEGMVGEDGRRYTVPSNYASKSKLVEGDLLRLTIDHAGRFIFKQKGPIERERLIGMLVQDEQTGEWLAAADGRTFRILAASVSYFHGAVGDDVVMLVPKNAPSRFAAVENIIKPDEGVF